MNDTVENEDPRERRRFFRIDDSVSLKLKSVNKADVENVLNNFEERRTSFCFLNEFTHMKEKHLPNRRVVEKTNPEIYAYFKYIEKKLDAVIGLIAINDEQIPGVPTHNVNISAQGIRFYTNKKYKEDDLVEIRMQLYPSGVRILILGAIVWCIESEDEDTDGLYAVAVDYKNIHAADKELLSRHIHSKQINDIRQK